MNKVRGMLVVKFHRFHQSRQHHLHQIHQYGLFVLAMQGYILNQYQF
jgi:hypothetical protein